MVQTLSQRIAASQEIDCDIDFGQYSVAMTKSLFYRWFGVGRMPEQLKATLTSEGLIVFDDGVKSSVTYRDFRAPGKAFLWRRVGSVGCLALTKVRLVALQNGNFVVNVPLTDDRLQRMNFAVEESGAFAISFDPNLFHDDWSGTIEYRFRTDVAQDLLNQLRQQSLSS